MKKLIALSVFLFIPVIAILFVQCSEQTVEPNDKEMIVSTTKGIGEVPVGNNLSFPAFLADGYTINPITGTQFDSIYPGPYDLLTADQLVYDWFAQKVAVNVWQAGFMKCTDISGGENVAFIDWGDNIESVNPKVDRPFRLEVTLYNNAASEQLDGYTMTVLANPSSPDEIQGTNGVTYKGIWATIASPKGKIVVQKFDAGSTLTWDPVAGKWIGAGDPDLSFGFAVELNVGGKLIYGASQGGWEPTVAGNYRITFHMPGSEVNLRGAAVGNYAGNVEDVTPSESLNRPVVDAINNLTYVDVLVVEGGGQKK